MSVARTDDFAEMDSELGERPPSDEASGPVLDLDDAILRKKRKLSEIGVCDDGGSLTSPRARTAREKKKKSDDVYEYSPQFPTTIRTPSRPDRPAPTSGARGRRKTNSKGKGEESAIPGASGSSSLATAGDKTGLPSGKTVPNSPAAAALPSPTLLADFWKFVGIHFTPLKEEDWSRLAGEAAESRDLPIVPLPSKGVHFSEKWQVEDCGRGGTVWLRHRGDEVAAGLAGESSAVGDASSCADEPPELSRQDTGSLTSALAGLTGGKRIMTVRDRWQMVKAERDDVVHQRALERFQHIRRGVDVEVCSAVFWGHSLHQRLLGCLLPVETDGTSRSPPAAMASESGQFSSYVLGEPPSSIEYMPQNVDATSQALAHELSMLGLLDPSDRFDAYDREDDEICCRFRSAQHQLEVCRRRNRTLLRDLSEQVRHEVAEDTKREADDARYLAVERSYRARLKQKAKRGKAPKVVINVSQIMQKVTALEATSKAVSATSRKEETCMKSGSSVADEDGEEVEGEPPAECEMDMTFSACSTEMTSMAGRPTFPLEEVDKEVRVQLDAFQSWLTQYRTTLSTSHARNLKWKSLMEELSKVLRLLVSCPSLQPSVEGLLVELRGVLGSDMWARMRGQLSAEYVKALDAAVR